MSTKRYLIILVAIGLVAVMARLASDDPRGESGAAPVRRSAAEFEGTTQHPRADERSRPQIATDSREPIASGAHLAWVVPDHLLALIRQVLFDKDRGFDAYRRVVREARSADTLGSAVCGATLVELCADARDRRERHHLANPLLGYSLIVQWCGIGHGSIIADYRAIDTSSDHHKLLQSLLEGMPLTALQSEGFLARLQEATSRSSRDLYAELRRLLVQDRTQAFLLAATLLPAALKLPNSQERTMAIACALFDAAPHEETIQRLCAGVLAYNAEHPQGGATACSVLGNALRMRLLGLGASTLGENLSDDTRDRQLYALTVLGLSQSPQAESMQVVAIALGGAGVGHAGAIDALSDMARGSPDESVREIALVNLGAVASANDVLAVVGRWPSQGAEGMHAKRQGNLLSALHNCTQHNPGDRQILHEAYRQCLKAHHRNDEFELLQELVLQRLDEPAGRVLKGEINALAADVTRPRLATSARSTLNRLNLGSER